MKFRKHILLLAALFCAVNTVFSINDSLINRLDFRKLSSAKLNLTFNNGNLKNEFIVDWLYFSNDNPSHKFNSLKDSGYKVIKNTQLYLLDEDSTEEKDPYAVDFFGTSWYKMYFKLTPGNEDKIYEMYLTFNGAAEVYYDGTLIKKFGTIGTNPSSLRVTDKKTAFYVRDTSTHCISIRYSLNNYKALQEKYDNLEIGPNPRFNTTDEETNDDIYVSIYYSITNMLSAFFIALFVIHLLIFFFYREKTFNLYYSLFLLFLSLSFFENYYLRFIENLDNYLLLNRLDDLLFPACCFFLVTLLNKLLNVKITRHYKFFTGMFILFIIDTLFINKFSQTIYISMVFYAYFNTLAHSVVGIRRGIASSKFLGWGILSFTLAIILAIILAFLMSTVLSDSDTIEGLFVYLLVADVIIAVLSIPISMTAYLAYDFSRTNKDLSSQLKANEVLNKKSLEQEKEKQEILENQNKVLESQVNERTKEIGEQNKVLEHQKKEITDSINYAKRIQQALLPEMESIKTALPNSFVYYVPKDIVSGDFYFFNAFSKKEAHPGRKESSEEAGLFIAAADCTGHGVPGALMSMIVHEKLENATKYHGEPSEILHSVNKQVKDALKQHQTDASRDGCDIALCKIQGNTLSYAGAYRPLYLFYKNGEFVEIKATKTAIAGLTPYDQKFDQHQFDTTELKAVYMFSDGFADQFGGQKSKKLTTKKFKELLHTIVNLPINEQNSQLEAFFTNWRGNVEQIDDVLVIGITFP
jgi:serine phosphatase RsbU (regulator of sigma subunit)